VVYLLKSDFKSSILVAEIGDIGDICTTRSTRYESYIHSSSEK